MSMRAVRSFRLVPPAAEIAPAVNARNSGDFLLLLAVPGCYLPLLLAVPGWYFLTVAVENPAFPRLRPDAWLFFSGLSAVSAAAPRLVDEITR